MIALTTVERARLGELEATIAAGLTRFVAVGEALEEIRRNGLWRGAGYEDFPDYCRRKWHLDYVHCWRLIKAAEVARTLPRGNAAPTSEYQVRPLVGMSQGDRDLAYGLAVEQAGGRSPPARVVQTTAALVREARSALGECAQARAAELDREQLLREQQAAANRRLERSREQDLRLALEHLRQAGKCVARLGWADLRDRCAVLALDVEQKGSGKLTVDNGDGGRV